MKEIQAIISDAAKFVGVTWPLDRSVAVNPLLDATDLPFEQAVTELSRQLGASVWPAAEHLDEARRRGLGVSLAELSARPNVRPATAAERCEGLQIDSNVLRRLVGEILLEAVTAGGERTGQAIDRIISVIESHRGWLNINQEFREHLVSLIRESDLGDLFSQLGTWSDEEVTEECRRHFARLPGWSAWAKWNDNWARSTHSAQLSLQDLLHLSIAVDLVAIRIQGLPIPAAAKAEVNPTDRAGRISLQRLEDAAYSMILQRLHSGTETSPHAQLQVVTCIDVRSEPLRRALERNLHVETFGFAGFFGIPTEILGSGESESYESLPVLVSPAGTTASGEIASSGSLLRLALGESFAQLTHEPRAMFALAEGAGWLGFPWVSLKRLRDGGSARCTLRPTSRWNLPDLDWASVAESALRGMGLTKNFAAQVIFIGHGSTTTANPHFATLDCGACAGHSGAPNAQILAEILNRTDIRLALMNRGISIPVETIFLAGEHNTTTETVTIFGDDASRFQLLLEIFEIACGELAQERTSEKRAHRLLSKKAKDWAETRPEWGLAGHISFVIGNRRSMRGCDLEGKSFLHSYDPETDLDGSILTSIFAAPVVVAHWINMSYYFSTVAPERLGAGDKSLLNPVGDFAVIAGDDPDLRIGLPWQSVAAPDRPYHLPVRLMVAVEAPLARIEKAISADQNVSNLVRGRWIRVVARPDASGEWSELETDGSWRQFKYS